MKNHLFNKITWADFTSLPNDLTPVLKLVEVRPEEPVLVNGLTIRPVLVSHIVPTTGFIVEDKKSCLAFSSDTGPTHRFWEIVNGVKTLKGILPQPSFPDHFHDPPAIPAH